MNKRKLLFALAFSSDYDSSIDIPIEYALDEEINECLLYMYVFMLTDESYEKHEEYYNEFCKRYEKLSKEKQLVVKDNYENIIKAQDEEEKNNTKVKKKGNDKYE